MRKKLQLIKSLLVAACLMVGGSSAWGADILTPSEATVIHGNGSSTSDFKSAASTVYYNASATTWNFSYASISGTTFKNQLSSWDGSPVAIIKFDASTVLSGKTLTGATLKFHSKCTVSGKNSNVDVAVIGTEWTASTATWDNTNTGTILSPAAISTGTNVNTSGHDFSINVMSQLSSDEDKVIGFAFYTETGREQELSDVTLEIESSTGTVYTATFTETNGLTPTVTIYSDAEMTTTVNNGALANGTTYYYKAVLAGYKDYTGSFTVSGANPSVSFTMTAKSTYTYTVNAVDGSSNKLKELATGSAYEGDDVTVAYPRFVLSSTNLYCSGSGSVTYSTTFSLNTNNFVKNVEYNSGIIGNVVYYTEGEDVTGASTGTNAARASMGKMGYTGSATTYLDVTTLAPGKYQLFARGQNGNNTARVFSFKVGEDEVYSGSIAKGTNMDSNSSIFTVTTAATLSFACEGSSASGLDYFYIVKVGSTTIPTSGYATISASYPLDLANLPSGVKAYKVKSITNTAVALEEVTEAVAAGTGLILEGAAGSYNIPVAASGTDISATNKLKAAVTATEVAANAAYVLKDGKFCLVTAASSVPAGKAYLQASDVPATARELNIEEGTTGINSVQDSRFMVNDYYDLQGRRVAQPTKGLYIQNGRKVLVK